MFHGLLGFASGQSLRGRLDHVKVTGLVQMMWPLGESQGPSQLHGHGHWLVCEVAPRLKDMDL